MKHLYPCLFLLFSVAIFGQAQKNTSTFSDKRAFAGQILETRDGRKLTDPVEIANYFLLLESDAAISKPGSSSFLPLTAVNFCTNGGFEEFEPIGSTGNFLKYFRFTTGEPGNPSECRSVSTAASNDIHQYNPAYTGLMASTVPSNFIDEFIGDIHAYDQYALMINWKNSSPTQGIVQTKRIKTNNENLLQFNYKAVLQSILSDTDHDDNQPFFKARVLNHNGQTVSEFCLIGEQTNCIFTKAPYLENGEIVLYTANWQSGLLDISSIANNEEFTVEFVASRCGLNGHFGYAYVDDLCLLHSNENIQGSIELDPLYKICPALPVQVCGDFTIPNSGGISASVATITLKVYDATNAVIYTSTTPAVLDIPNRHFCFSIAAANLPDVTAGNYNVGVTISYNVAQTGCAGTTFNSASDNDANPGWDISFMNCASCSFTVQPASLSQCDPDHNGKAFFSLNLANTTIGGTQTGLSFGYFETLADATANTNPIANFSSYESTSKVIFVRVTKSATCFRIIAFQLFVSNPGATISGILNVCAGATMLTASSGAAYLWSTGATSQTVSVDAVGTYSVTVTDAAGCAGQASVTISPNQVAVQPNLVITQPDCFVDTGTISITSPAALYSFDNGATWTSNSVKTNLAVGSYAVKIQTAAGCLSYAVNVSINQFYLPFPNFTTVQPGFCGDTGSITITSSATEYSFDDGVTWTTNNTLSNLPSGIYKIRFKNQFGCISNFNSVVLNSEFLPEPTHTSIPPVCGVGGSITITTPATEYSFDGGQTWGTSNTFTGPFSGNSIIKIKNATGCTSASDYVYLTDFNETYPQYDSVQPVCGTGGSITVTTVADLYSFDGGTTWSSNPVATGLAPGSYHIRVKTATGCMSYTAYVYLYEFHLPSPIYTSVGPSCGNGGSITITTPAAFYSFDGGTTWSSNATATNLPSGSYEVMIKNDLDCISYSSYIYLYETFLPNPIYTVVQPTCDAGGTITITTAAAQYSIDDGVTWLPSNIVANLPPGFYQIRIRDANGCTSQSQYTYLYEPHLDDPAYTVIHPFCTETTGTITITPVAGCEYSFDYGTIYQSSNISDPLTPGYYGIKIRNATGCESATDYVSIHSPSGIPSMPSGDMAQLYCIFNNPTMGFLVAAGQDLHWYDSNTSTTPLDLSTPLIDGMTYYAAQTVSGCESQVRLPVTVTLSDYVIPSSDFETLVCDDLNNGNEIVSLMDYEQYIVASPAIYTFTYYKTFLGAETKIPGDLIGNAGNYPLLLGDNELFVRVVSTNGCYNVAKLKLTLIPSPYVTMRDSYILCENTTIPIRADSGFDGYLWSTGQTSQTIYVSVPGNYSVTVSENHGAVVCTTTQTIAVVPSNMATISEVITADWTDDNNTIAVELSDSSIGIYEYSLDGVHFQDSNTFGDLESGEYVVYVRDKNGCGTVNQEVFLLMYPKYFTPNFDGFHDTWKIKFAVNEPGLKVKIFDRHGKFIASLDYDSYGWDGTYNKEELPSSDYWFSVTRANGRQYRGHFTLKR
jgi:gliding motility-associated-like protein